MYSFLLQERTVHTDWRRADFTEAVRDAIREENETIATQSEDRVSDLGQRNTRTNSIIAVLFPSQYFNTITSCDNCLEKMSNNSTVMLLKPALTLL